MEERRTDRTGTEERNTRETRIRLVLNMDGKGEAKVRTGIGFFDHMLQGFARHGLFNMDLDVEGDLEVDTHHTAEDTGIVLGRAIKGALRDKAGIVRYGSAILPMDDALILCSVDLCGRPYLGYDLRLDREKVGELETETVREFFYAVSYGAEMNLHLKQLDGFNSHHIIEGAFKAFAKALSQAIQYDRRIEGVLSTKGTL
ncbi:MAG: imidazoleglycerol-phosphate dehydratase HisB [Hungatella sp.]|nr:imidazoleglycerol-phosphate dehydratase HisB [Hungatella sp.]